MIQINNVLDDHDGNQTTVSCYLQCQMRYDENSKRCRDQLVGYGSEQKMRWEAIECVACPSFPPHRYQQHLQMMAEFVVAVVMALGATEVALKT